MRIGELAQRTGCDSETIRYYEKIGLLAAPARNDAGYRDYRQQHQETLQFIRHGRSLQMGLADIRTLLQFKNAPGAPCAGVNALLDHHIEQIQAQMSALRQLEQQLTTLRHQCAAPELASGCGILQNLDDAARSAHCVCHPAG
ncbi:MAG: Cd(II)/Pb(II)-responsive transcriptional regulator [Janthinobacterium lividum]